jgi:U4/U6.U5 tri-snRNP-associated protein 3
MDDDSNARRTEDDPLEEQRRLKMAKLRAENEAEERRLADIRKAALKSSLDTSTTTEKNQAGVAKEKILEIHEGELDEYEEEEQMQMLLGFSNGFTSTKGKAVEDNQTSAAKGAAAKNKARKYRQYMNRKGGFNRPLDKMN